jgi:hypothetical protein
MEEESVYATPKAEGLADGEYQTIGGWLRFYQVINWISLILIILVLLMTASFMILNLYAENELFEAMITSIELIPDLVLTFMTLRILKIREKDIPTRIVQYLSYYVGASLLMYGFVYYLFKTGVVVEKPIGFWGTVIYFAIWNSYFKKSERVGVYYGGKAIG